MRILLSNDDGILAPGLLAMQEALVTLGDVDVVAPQSPQSAAAHAITIPGPVAVQRVHIQDSFSGYSVDGRPADCVKLAITELLEHKPDLVVSGINDGANVGINVLYSGTVAAAAEGALLGLPAVAVSMKQGEKRDFRHAARIALPIIRRLLERGLKGGQLVNINIPDLTQGPPRGIRVVPQSTKAMEDRFTRHRGPDGKDYYWLASDPLHHDENRGSDLDTISKHCVAVTPLHFDLTDYQLLRQHQDDNWLLEEMD